MSAIVVMLRKSLKNALMELLHHPGKLILYLIVGAMLVFSALSNITGSGDDSERMILDQRILQGIYLALLLLISIPTILRGLNSGTTFFSMSDVSLLFVSPISSKKILVYGLLKQMGATLLVAFFLLAYGGMAIRTFAIQVWQALLLLAGFALTILVGQILTMTVYSYVNGNKTRIRAVKFAMYALLAAAAAYVGFQIYGNGLSEESIYSAISSPALRFIPIAGWMQGLIFALFSGSMGDILLFGGLLLLGTCGCLLLFLRSDADYYEDVLQNTETTYAMRQAVKEGRVTAGSMNNRSPKVKTTGLNAGWGASAFFYKQMREIRRRSPFAFVSASTVCSLIIGVFLGFVMTRGEDSLSSNAAMAIVLAIGVYVLFFLNAAGEWGREIMKPYLYMVPEPPLKKLLWASLTSLLKPVIDGALLFGAVGVVTKGSPFTVLVCVSIYASFGCLFTSSNILSQRLLGAMANKGLILVLYSLMLLALVLPGAVIGLVLYFVFHVPGPVMGIPVALWNAAVSFGILAICQNLLHDMETH